MTEIKLLSDSEIEIAGEISAGDFMFEKDPALKEMTRNLDIKGFRKGKIPEDIILKNVNQRAILERMAVMALEKKYPEIIKKNKIKPIGRPEIIITKMAENNPLGFKIKTAVMPEIKLSDYKNIAGNIAREKKENINANDKEIIKEREKTRIKILDKIIESAKLEVPNILIEEEKGKMLLETRNNVVGAGLKWEDYLKHIKKTEEELKISWEEDAAKRVKYGLVLNEMAEKEKIEVSDEELNKETEKIIRHQTNTRQNINKERLKTYVYGIMRNEKLFQLLEKVK